MHFTWWLLALAIVLMLLGVSTDIGFWVQAVIIMVGCLGGAVMVLIGYGVIRREVHVLDESYEIYDRLGKAMDLEGDALAAPGSPNKGLRELVAGAFVAACVYFVAFIGALVFAVLQ